MLYHVVKALANALNEGSSLGSLYRVVKALANALNEGSSLGSLYRVVKALDEGSSPPCFITWSKSLCTVGRYSSPLCLKRYCDEKFKC